MQKVKTLFAVLCLTTTLVVGATAFEKSARGATQTTNDNANTSNANTSKKKDKKKAKDAAMAASGSQVGGTRCSRVH